MKHVYNENGNLQCDFDYRATEDLVEYMYHNNYKWGREEILYSRVLVYYYEIAKTLECPFSPPKYWGNIPVEVAQILEGMFHRFTKNGFVYSEFPLYVIVHLQRAEFVVEWGMKGENDE